MEKRTVLKFVIFSMNIVLTGCHLTNSVYDYNMRTKVEAVADTSVDQSKYNRCYLVTDYDIKTIRGKQYANFFKDSFSAVGIEITPDKSKANCVLVANFNATQQTYTINEPVYGETGISSATSRTDYLGQTTTTFQPSYGITGYVPTKQLVGSSNLNVSAQTKSGEEIWKVFVSITNLIQSVSDIEKTIGNKAIPVLINTAAVFSRENTKSSYMYSQLESDLLLQYRAKELNYKGTTRLHPLTEKVSDVNTVANWNACEGETTIEVLTRWAKRVGYTLEVSDDMKNKKVKYDQPYQGKFADVLSQYLENQGLKPILDTSKKTLSIE